MAGPLHPRGRLERPAVIDHQRDHPLAGAAALQALMLALARARRTNPDLIRREEAPYRHAAQVAEDAPDW